MKEPTVAEEYSAAGGGYEKYDDGTALNSVLACWALIAWLSSTESLAAVALQFVHRVNG